MVATVTTANAQMPRSYNTCKTFVSQCHVASQNEPKCTVLYEAHICMCQKMLKYSIYAKLYSITHMYNCSTTQTCVMFVNSWY